MNPPFWIFEMWRPIRNKRAQKFIYTNYNVYTVIFSNFGRDIESAILNFENLTSDS